MDSLYQSELKEIRVCTPLRVAASFAAAPYTSLLLANIWYHSMDQVRN